MTEVDLTNLSPNVIQIYPGFIRNLFWDYFCYIDKKSYTIDGILNMYEIPVTFLKAEYHKPNGNYAFCLLKCAKKYTGDLLDKVFPKLHQSNIVLDGTPYVKECEDAMKVFLNYMKDKQEK